jgi:hypothetical protein
LGKLDAFTLHQKVCRKIDTINGSCNHLKVNADPAVHQRRVKAGGNKKPKFVEGWVEFVEKKDAKAVAEALNNQPVGAMPPMRWRHDTVARAHVEFLQSLQKNEAFTRETDGT